MSDTVKDDTTDDTTSDTAPEAVEPDPDAVAITINGTKITARKGEMLIAAAERNGEYIPRFCYHNRLKPVGMCRQCMVEVDTGRGPGLQPSCMVPVSADMVVDTQSPVVKRAQQGIIELLLANHPLDCPVCDKGGECPLQDQAYGYGPGESRFVEEKRHFEKPIAISEHILLDRERCILCDRCTRFADEVAGDKLIHFIDRGNFTQVATFPDEPFSSYFSGNIAQICPVGALTAKPYRFKARPWDLEQVESTCTSCAVGCRVSLQSSRDELLRVQGVDIDSVNWGWLCDRGRFNFEAVESPERLGYPLARTEDGLVETTWTTAMKLTADILAEATDGSTIGILGGARSTNEGAFAWARLADALDVKFRDAQLGDGLPAQILGQPRATIDEMSNAKTVVLLGPDLKEELPILYLRLRHAAVNGDTKIIEFAERPTGMTPYAWKTPHYQAGAVRAAIDAAFGDPEVQAQLELGDVVVVAGRTNLAESESFQMAGVRALLDRLPDAKVLPALRRGNVVGALQLGMAPSSSDTGGLATLTAAASGELDVLFLVGADPLADCPDLDLARRALAGARRVISLDTVLSMSSEHADIVFPVAGFAEQAGTTTNLEGRVAPINIKVTPPGAARTDWMVAAEIAMLAGHDLGFDSVESVTTAIERTVPAYAGAATTGRTDPEGFVAVVDVAVPAAETFDDINPAGYDYRLLVSRVMYDQATSTINSPSLIGLVKSAAAFVHPLDLDKVGVADGSEVSVIGARGAAVLPLRGDDRVPRGTLFVGFNQPGHTRITEVIDSAKPVIDVRIERLGGPS